MDQIWLLLIMIVIGLVAMKFAKPDTNKKQLDYELKDSELRKMQNEIDSNIIKARKELELRKKELEGMTPKEIEEYWNGKKNS